MKKNKLLLLLLALQTSNIAFGLKDEGHSLLKSIAEDTWSPLPDGTFKEEALPRKKKFAYSGLIGIKTGAVAYWLSNSRSKSRKSIFGGIVGFLGTYALLTKYGKINPTKKLNDNVAFLSKTLKGNEQAQLILQKLGTINISQLTEAELAQTILAALNDAKKETTFTQKQFFDLASPKIKGILEALQAIQKQQALLPEEEQPAETASERQRLAQALTSDLTLLSAIQDVLNNPFEWQQQVITALEEKNKSLQHAQNGNKSLSEEHARNIASLEKTHETALQEKNNTLQDLKGTLLQLQQKHMSCGERLEGQKSQYENKLSVLQRERATLQKSFSILENEHKNCVNLNAQVQDLTAQAVAMQQTIDAARADEEKKAVELTVMSEQLQKLGQERDAAHATIQSLKESLATAEKELAALPEGKSINDLRQALEQKERVNTRLNRELDVKKEMYAQLTKEYNVVVEEKEKALAKEAETLNRLNNLKAKL